MRQKHSMTWNMARQTENVKNKKCKLLDKEYCEKTEKGGKMKHKHCLTCIIARNTQKRGK